MIDRVRGSWRVDEKTGEVVECVRADAYAEQVEKEQRESELRNPRPRIVR